jgi:hypothetical protein
MADPGWLEKMQSIGSISRRTADQVTEGRDARGQRYKAVTDGLGNTVTQRAGDRQDVHIKAPTVAMSTAVQEVRD